MKDERDWDKLQEIAERWEIRHEISRDEAIAQAEAIGFDIDALDSRICEEDW
jgi:hypothetical protein